MPPVEALIRKVFKLSDAVALPDDFGPGDIPGWDSLGMLNLLGAVEKEFGVSLGLEDMARLDSVAGVRRILAEKRIDLNNEK